MNGIERIGQAFSTEKDLKIMTHVVGGYPDLPASEAIVLLMASMGVDLVEIQIPFSDPIADGPVIVQANHQALANGVTTEDVLKMAERLRKKTDIPLLLMSYINPVFAHGPEKIIERAAQNGIDGFIVPDYPIDEADPPIARLCREHGLAQVPLIAPTTSDERMQAIVRESDSPFVYAVLRLGVTGQKTELKQDSIDYLRRVKEITGRYVAAGFGIAEKSQLQALQGLADCAVIGSALLRAIQSAGDKQQDILRAVRLFLEGALG